MIADNTTSNKRIARNSILLNIRMVFVLVLTLYTTRAVLSLLGVEDYGIYNVVCGFVSMFVFLNTAMSNGIQRFYNFELGKNGIEGAKRVYSASLIIQFVLAIIIILFAETFGLWYLHNKMVIPEERVVAADWIYQFSVLGFIFVIFQAPYAAAVMAHEKMDYFALISVLDAVLKLAIVFLIPLFTCDTLVIYGLLMTSICGLDFFLYWIYCKRKFEEITFIKRQPIGLYKSMLSFSGWNIFGALSSVMKEQGINMVINLFFGPVVNAARGVASQVNSGLMTFVQNVAIPVRPQVIQSYAAGDVERSMRLTFSVSKLSSCMLLLVALPVVLEIDFILKIWLGANIPEHTATFVFIIVLTCIISNLNYAISGVVHASGKMALYQIAGGLAGILSVPAAYIVLKMGGSPESAIWVSFWAMVIGQINALLILKSIVDYSIKDYIKNVIFPFSLVTIIAFIFSYIPLSLIEEGLLRLIVVTIVSFLSICITTYYVALDSGEKELISQLLKSFNKRRKQ